MISEIKIQGYKSIQNQSVKLGNINILIGANGVGKSNFISCFSFLKAIYNGNLNGYVISKGGANNLLYQGKKMTPEMEVQISFESKNNLTNDFTITMNEMMGLLAYKSSAFRPEIPEKEIHYIENKISNEGKSINIQQSIALDSKIGHIETYHFQDTGDQSPMKGLANLNDNVQLKKDGANIAPFLYYLQEKHPKHFYRIEKTIQSIAPFFDKFDLKPNRLNERTIQLEWKEFGAPDTYFNEYNLSDGTLRFICLATLLMQPNPPKTIVIDEPELGLHPVAINKLSGLIKKASTNSQIIISTQSIDLINYFEPKNIIVANRENSATTFKRLNIEELSSWLEEYSLGEVWEKNIFGGSPYSVY